MPTWVIWALVAVALAIGEMTTPGALFLGPLVPAALLALVVALLGGGLALSLVVFAVGSVASLALLRPIAKRHMRTPPRLRTGTAALVGARAVVVDRVDGDGGRVKIGGEVWSARSIDDTVIEPGTRVQVAQIEGATALVYE